MEVFMKKISRFVLLSVLAASTVAILPPLPDISSINIMFYQTEVQVTDLAQNVAAFAKEYYDGSSFTSNRGRVELVVAGEKRSIFYNNETNELLEIAGTKCSSSPIDESLYDYEAMFYGWLFKEEPLVIGPSALLWYGSKNKDKALFKGHTEVRGIMCNTWELPIEDERDDINITYYFATEDWKTPYQLDGLRVPVRIAVKGFSSRDVKDADTKVAIELWNDFAYFRPTIDDWLALQPPLGIGCPDRESSDSMPKLPKVFRYNAEVFDVMQTDPDNPKLTYDVEFQEIYYDSTRLLARRDKYTKAQFTSELYDFNTGVMYVNTDGSTCSIRPLRNAEFEAYDAQMIGHMKEPDEVLNLQGTFYYMGKRLMRGIWCNTFESAVTDVTFMKKDLNKLVISIYFSQDYYEVLVDGETETRIPVFYVVTGYDKADKVAINLQYNIFEFSDMIYPDMYSNFDLDRCFPSTHDKSYFLLFFDVNPQIAKQMEGMDEIVIAALRNSISAAAKITDLRLPMLKADYKTSGVYVTGLMLDRPPALAQFYKEFSGDVNTDDPYLKPAIDADSKEKCAYACVDNFDFTCLGFYWCNQACFLKSKGILEPAEKNPNNRELGKCDTYLRVNRESTNEESYLQNALENLEWAVDNSTLTVTLNVKVDGKNAEEIIPASQFIPGIGPYTGKDNADLPYDLVIKYAKLNPEDENSQIMPDLESLNECYQACKNSGSLSCASFSYCPDSADKQCTLSSNLVVSRKTNPDDTTDSQNCYVYSLKFLDFYTAYPGKSILAGGEDVVKSIETPEECAKVCRETTKFTCRGFEICKTQKSCVLHTKHVLDLKPGEMGTGKSTCTHYAAKFTADYDDLGFTLVDDDSNVRNELTLEECSRVCSEEEGAKCKSFNYCPASGPYMTDSTCALSEKTLETGTTTTKGKCHHFEKKPDVDDWSKKSAKKTLMTSGYTAKGFTGLVIGMLAFGLILGAVGFIGYSYYRSRSSGDGMSVRFMKQPT